MGQRGVPECLVEDGVLGNLAPPGDLEESASHHMQILSHHTNVCEHTAPPEMKLQTRQA